jgi:hypothetical protein
MSRRISLALLVAPLAMWILTFQPAPKVHVRWRPSLPESSRRSLERQFLLVNPTDIQHNTWAYDLLDTSTRNVRALVQHPDAEDTHDIDRHAFRVATTAAPRSATTWIANRMPGFRLPWVGVVFFYGLIATGAIGLFSSRGRSTTRRD